MIIVETMRTTDFVVGPVLLKLTRELERAALMPVALKLTLAARVIVPVNPLIEVTVRFELPLVPRTSVRLLGFRDSVKSGDVVGAWVRPKALVKG